ncbi:Protein of unknown function [Devosia crocina]|uniref:DUF3168 domain-containing protein n=1 Tax=Devosia crocina TaxID=429728 RepID=A0A1I7NF57_9HYPH|nr:DUF3168 domain-containing protein [Devosia crocina]SFV33176.1 Protein of unknown function [Devosia crocina]
MEPTYELQLAALNKLRETPALVAIVENKIFDRVPERNAGGVLVPDVSSPYISFGPVIVDTEDADCIDGLSITFQIDVWSWGSGEAYGSVQTRKIVGEVRKALHRANLPMSSNALVSIEAGITRILRESDGVTNHGVIQFTALVETH